jgi:hypothetical protein
LLFYFPIPWIFNNNYQITNLKRYFLIYRNLLYLLANRRAKPKRIAIWYILHSHDVAGTAGISRDEIYLQSI